MHDCEQLQPWCLRVPDCGGMEISQPSGSILASQSSDNANTAISPSAGRQLSAGSASQAVSPRSPSSPATPAELQRALERLFAGVVRGAAIGFTLRGGLHIVGSLLTAISKRRKRAVTLPAAIEDTLRYTAFLASLAGVYIGVDEGIAALMGKEKSARWRSLVAGVCAGPTLLLTGPGNRHYSLATYILLRGLTLLIRVGNKERNKQRHPALHTLLAPTRIEHGDTMLMCAACSQIIYAFIMMPHTLPQSYVRWIRKQGAKELYVWQGVRELAERTAAGKPLGPLTSLMGTPYAHRVAPIPCHFFHPGQTCWQHPMQLLVPAYGRALSVYIPVYLLPALLVHRQEFLKRPLPLLQKVVQGVARSSLFLSAFISMAFGGACLGHNLTGRSTGLVVAFSTWLGGLATLLEKKSRRLELALYVLSRSLESLGRCCVDWRWVSPRWLPPRSDVLLFAAGVGAILHCYSDSNGVHRDVFRSKYLGVFDFVFGNTGFTEGRIKHVPSNQDLLKHMSAAVSGRMRGRSQSTNSLSTMARVRTRSPSLGDLHSVLESPAAHQLRHSQSAASQATHAEPDQQQDHVSVLPAQQQQQLGSSPAAAEQEAAADTGSSVLAAASEAAAAALAAVAEQSQQRGGSVVAAAAVSSGLAVDVSSSSSSPVQVCAAVCMTAESSAVVVPAGGECGNTSSGSPGSSFSEVEAAASSDAGHEGLSMSM